MTTYIIITYFHYIAFIVLFSSLIIEHLLLRPNIDGSTARRLVIIDMLYGIAAGVVLLTGVLKTWHFGKGIDYYADNIYFQIKIGIFIGIALLSIYPTIIFLKWRGQLRQKLPLTVEHRVIKCMVMVLRLELLAAFSLPLFAILIAHGV